MRVLLLLGLLALSLLQVTLADTVGLAPEAVEDEVDGLVDMPTDHDLDMTSFFKALFDDSDDEEVSGRESRQMEDGSADDASAAAETKEEEQRAVADRATVEKYNEFTNLFLARVNSALKDGGDPMKVRLTKPKGGNKKNKKGGKGKKNKGKGKNKKSKKSKKGKGKGKARNESTDKADKKNKNNRARSGRHPKDLDLESLAEDDDAAIEVVAVEDEADEEEEHSRTKREIDVELVEHDGEEEEDIESAIEEVNARESKSIKAKKHGLGMEKRVAHEKRIRAGKKAGKGGKGKKRAQKKGANKKGKNQKKKGKKSGAKKGKKTSPSFATIMGFSTLRRKGNVQITQNNKIQRIKTDIVIGPVTVEVSKKFGKDDTRTAKAFASRITGTIIIEVNRNGAASIAKFKINAPEATRTAGSLAKADAKKKVQKGAEKLLKTSIKRVTPKVSKKMLMAARKVLSTTSSKVRGSN